MSESKWSEKLINKWQESDIPGQIDEIQGIYNRWMTICAGITLVGLGVIIATPGIRIIALGLFIAITGVVFIALMKIWAYIKLSMLRVIWKMQEENRDNPD